MSRSSHSSSAWLFSFVDLLLAVMFVLMAYAYMARIQPPAEVKPDAAEPPGKLAVTAMWLEGNDDVDLWVLPPDQKEATGYSNKQGKVAALLRDDLGNATDVGPLNAEYVFASDIPAGEYVVNVHGYRLTKPTTVYVEIAITRNGHLFKLAETKVDLRDGQERTVVRFKLDVDGQVVPRSVSTVFEPLRSAKK